MAEVKQSEASCQEHGRKIPNHVAIILDGNGRLAKSKGMPRNYGHVQGAKNVETILSAAHDMGIRYVTMYAFSTENWNRPKEEVDALLSLLHSYMKTCLRTARKNNMRCRVIGDITRLDQPTQYRIHELVESSKEYTGLNFTIAINYGGRDEITRAVRRIAEDHVEPERIDEQLISSYLDTGSLPDPDLLIRTSGEQRLSNYLLWQLAYTEFYFTEVPWPAFTREELEKAVDFYNQRERRFGGV